MPLFGKPTARDNQRANAYRDWLHSRNPFAIASLVLGIFSLIELGAILIFGIAGIALGIIALRQLKLPSGKPLGHHLAWAGILTSAVSLVIAARLYGWI